MKRLVGTRNILFILLLLAIPAASFAGIAVSITVAPPALPVYAQPPCPVDGYLWTPGYWAWGPDGYFWVPGAWVAPPTAGLLWTPGYWGFVGGSYLWHAGYWGPHVGFYGGINYGFGYPGRGFYGGVWSGGAFRYNTAVVNVNRTMVHNTYVDRSFVHNTVVNNRTSYNGGRGVNASPTPNERMAMNERHFAGNQAGRQFGANRVNTAGHSTFAGQREQPRQMNAPTRGNVVAAQREQPRQMNAQGHGNVATPRQQPRQMNAPARANVTAPHQQPAQMHAMSRPSAPAQHAAAQPRGEMQARRESRGGEHAR